MTRRNMHSLDNQNAIPAFVTKLWSMVEDPKTDDIICWSKNGKCFLILDEKQFWYTLLPLYYKHNNMSSFIRQLNMYGFHKLTTYDLDSEEKHDYQFIHAYFQKGKMELLTNIKRKTTGSKILSGNANEDSHQLNQVFSDVQSLYSRQNQVDSVLNSLKQENAVLWRELALLRQKHKKQQQIVDKLIQFLVTMVQPSRLGGVLGLKRRPLMIHGTPPKRVKTNSDGPTIHELDNTEQPMEDMANTIGDVQIDSPASTSGPIQGSPDANVEEDVDLDVLINESDLEPAAELLSELELPEDANSIPTLQIPEAFNDRISDILPDSDQVLLGSNTQDTLLSSLLSGSYNNSDSNIKKETSQETYDPDNMSVATCGNSTPNPWLNTIEDIDNHLGITQSELEHIKKIFNGCSSVDAKYLLQLFNENPSYGLTPNETWDTLEMSDAVNGTEVTPYDSELLDFGDLLDSPSNSTEFVELPKVESLNTPEVMHLKPTFPPNWTKD